MRWLAALCGVTMLLGAPARARADEGCGTENLAEEAMAAIDQAVESETDGGKGDDAGTVYEVPVYLHVLRRAPQGEGDLPVARAKGLTVDVLNDVFADQAIPFRFVLAGIDYTNVDAETYHLEQNSARERAIYDATAVPGRRALNLYLVGPRAGTNVTGWAEFLVNPALRRGDHAVLRYDPAKGALSDPLVVVHEVGHWLGLLHTFQFGCGGLAHGDLIADTATQAEGHHQCGEVDTCTDDDGLDAVENIMGYSHGCRGLFSPGQVTRMKFLYRTARGGKSDDDVIVEVDVAALDDSGGCAAGGGATGSAFALALALAVRRRRR